MIKKYELKNDFMRVEILNLGGIIHGIYVPDIHGKLENVVYGFKSIEDYRNNPAYFGALIGRVAGRIKHGKFSLNGEKYQVYQKDRGNMLHGGLNGFDTKIWTVEEMDHALVLSYSSHDGEEGFPGKLDVKVTYTLEGDELCIEYEAVSDKDTYVNLTNHSYFNLNPESNILNTHLYVNSDHLIAIDETSIPTGELMDVTGTPFDFRRMKRIGRDIESHHEQLLRGGGYDHPWRLNEEDPKLVMHDEESGRVLTVSSDQQAVVLYSYNFPINQDKERLALAIEFQNDPDGMNQENLNNCLLKKGEKYHQKTVYKFEVSDE